MRARPRGRRRSATRSSPLLANADARPITTADGGPGRARRAPDRRRRLGRAPSSAMTAAGVDTFIEVGPGRVLTGLIKRIAPDAEAIALDDADAPDRLAVPFALAPHLPEPASDSERNPPSVRKPDYDRRVVVTGLGVVSPVGNDVQTAWDNLIRRPSPASPRSPSSTSARYEAQGRRRGPRLRRRRLDGPEGRPPQRDARCSSASPPAKQALADSGFEITDANREDVGVVFGSGRRRPAADDRQPGSTSTRRARGASRRRSSPTPSSTRRRG